MSLLSDLEELQRCLEDTTDSESEAGLRNKAAGDVGNDLDSLLQSEYMSLAGMSEETSRALSSDSGVESEHSKTSTRPCAGTAEAKENAGAMQSSDNLKSIQREIESDISSRCSKPAEIKDSDSSAVNPNTIEDAALLDSTLNPNSTEGTTISDSDATKCDSSDVNVKSTENTAKADSTLKPKCTEDTQVSRISPMNAKSTESNSTEDTAQSNSSVPNPKTTEDAIESSSTLNKKSKEDLSSNCAVVNPKSTKKMAESDGSTVNPKSTKKMAKSNGSTVNPKSTKKTAESDGSTVNPKSTKKTAESDGSTVKPKSTKKLTELDCSTVNAKSTEKMAESSCSAVNPKPTEKMMESDGSIVNPKPTEKMMESDGSTVNPKPTEKMMASDGSIVNPKPTEKMMESDCSTVNPKPTEKMMESDGSTANQKSTEKMAESDCSAVNPKPTEKMTESDCSAVNPKSTEDTVETKVSTMNSESTEVMQASGYPTSNNIKSEESKEQDPVIETNKLNSPEPAKVLEKDDVAPEPFLKIDQVFSVTPETHESIEKDSAYGEDVKVNKRKSHSPVRKSPGVKKRKLYTEPPLESDLVEVPKGATSPEALLKLQNTNQLLKIRKPRSSLTRKRKLTEIIDAIPEAKRKKVSTGNIAKNVGSSLPVEVVVSPLGVKEPLMEQVAERLGKELLEARVVLKRLNIPIPEHIVEDTKLQSTLEKVSQEIQNTLSSPSLDGVAPKKNNPSLDGVAQKKNNPSLDGVSQKKNNRSLDGVARKKNNPSLDGVAQKKNNRSLDGVARKKNNPSLDGVTPKKNKGRSKQLLKQPSSPPKIKESKPLQKRPPGRAKNSEILARANVSTRIGPKRKRIFTKKILASKLQARPAKNVALNKRNNITFTKQKSKDIIKPVLKKSSAPANEIKSKKTNRVQNAEKVVPKKRVNFSPHTKIIQLKNDEIPVRKKTAIKKVINDSVSKKPVGERGTNISVGRKVGVKVTGTEMATRPAGRRGAVEKSAAVRSVATRRNIAVSPERPTVRNKPDRRPELNIVKLSPGGLPHRRPRKNAPETRQRIEQNRLRAKDEDNAGEDEWLVEYLIDEDVDISVMKDMSRVSSSDDRRPSMRETVPECDSSTDKNLRNFRRPLSSMGMEVLRKTDITTERKMEEMRKAIGDLERIADRSMLRLKAEERQVIYLSNKLRYYESEKHFKMLRRILKDAAPGPKQNSDALFIVDLLLSYCPDDDNEDSNAAGGTNPQTSGK